MLEKFTKKEILEGLDLLKDWYEAELLIDIDGNELINAIESAKSKE